MRLAAAHHVTATDVTAADSPTGHRARPRRLRSVVIVSPAPTAFAPPPATVAVPVVATPATTG